MLREYMLSFGFSYEEINKIRNTYPVNKCSDDYLLVAVKNIFKIFMMFGYTKKQFIKIILERPHILCYGVNVIHEKILYFKKLFGNKESVIKVTTDFPTMLSYDIISVSNKIKDLEKIGFQYDDIIKNIKKYPEILGFNVEFHVKGMINRFKQIGFTQSEVLKIFSKNITILGRDFNSIMTIIDTLAGLGYNRNQIIDMIKKHPPIFNLSIQRITLRVNEIANLVSSYSNALEILKINPSLFSNDIDTLVDKKLFYDSIGLPDLFVKCPKDLIQSIAKSYARYMHLSSIGIKISDGYRDLFLGEKRFNSKYRVKTEDLIKIYNVDQYMASVKTRK